MTDYLSTLLVRNISTEPAEDVLHPRLRSRFEQSLMESQPSDVEISPRDVHTRPASGELPQQTPAPPTVFQKLSRPADKSQVTSRPAMLQPDIDLTEVPHSMSQAEVPLPTANPRTESSLRTNPFEKVNQLLPPLQPHPTLTMPLLVPRQPRNETGDQDTRLISVGRAEEGRPARREQRESAQVFPAPAPRMQVYEPTLPSRMLLSPPSLDVASSEQTVIHVSIGRVEVRAVQPSNAPAQVSTRKTSSIISLEEYLRRRSGGEA